MLLCSGVVVSINIVRYTCCVIDCTHIPIIDGNMFVLECLGPAYGTGETTELKMIAVGCKNPEISFFFVCDRRCISKNLCHN